MYLAAKTLTENMDLSPSFHARTISPTCLSRSFPP